MSDKSIDVDALAKMHPSEIDEQLADLELQRYKLLHRRGAIMTDVHYQGGSEKVYEYRRKDRWSQTDEQALAEVRAIIADGRDATAYNRYSPGARAKTVESLAEVDQQIAEVESQQSVLDEEYVRRGGWTRAFVVRGKDGHIHSSQHCHSCRPTTQFGWRPDYSGRPEAEIVEAAGMMACTFCYPSAPVDKQIPSKIEKMPKLG